MSPDRRARRARCALVLSLVCLTSTPAMLRAQASATPPAPPRAAPEDVASVDAILEAVYAVISGPAGERRDWDRFRSLFMPGARLMPTGGSAGQGYRNAVWSPSEYVTQAGASLERDGFFENEIHRVEERYGPVVHAFSTYESRRTEAAAEPFARGINSFQLFFDGTRWWVMSIFWYGETEETPIPARYLPG